MKNEDVSEKVNGFVQFNTFEGIKKRPLWRANPSIEKQNVDWKKLLALNNLYCIVGNQLISHVRTFGEKWPESHPLGVGDTKNEGYHYTSGKVEPGFECVEFYPLAKGRQNGGEMDVWPAVITFFDEHGNRLHVENDLEARRWRPDLQQEIFRHEKGAFIQKIACSDDILILSIKAVEGVLPMRFKIDCNFGSTQGIVVAEVNDSSTFVWGQEHDWSDTVFGLWCNKSADVANVGKAGEKIYYSLEGECGDELQLAFSVTYLITDLQKKMKSALKNPHKIFQDSTHFWDDYFTREVPYFDCSDLSYVRQYYYTFFCLRANVWDIPFHPFMYPYTCTSKLIWKWSWPWNSIFDNVSLRWLNDKSLAEGNVRLEFYLGRSVIQDFSDVGFPDLLPIEPQNAFPLSCGSITYNTSIYDAIWMTYMVSGNKGWLENLYPAIKKHYYEISKHCNNQGLAGWGLDEWDISARVKAFKPDTLVDSSCFLASGLDSLAKMADALGKKDDKEMFERWAEDIRQKIQILLWDKENRIFMDANLNERKFSSIKTAAAFDPLYCGAATEEQAENLVAEHLTNPKEFWTAYPIPAFSIDTPEFEPDGENIGNGPVAPISCGWFQINGLVRYGYDSVAAELVRRQMKMNTLNGVSSAVKFNPISGDGLQFFVSRKENHSLCTMNAIIVDLVIRYVVGFRPREDELIEFNPIALEENQWESLSWGPYQYRDKEISFKWTRNDGMTISCNQAEFRCPGIRRIVLRYLQHRLTEEI